LPNGAIVLPGLDQGLDEESWNRIVPGHPEHPQFGLKKMLDALGVRRQQVECLPGAAPSPAQRARASLVSEAMRPAATTQRWHLLRAPGNAPQMADARSGISILEAPSAADEAEAIALILRQLAETPERTGALVSPDRALTQRVAARLTSWGLEAEES